MLSLKVVRRRIRSVTSSKQITKAMEMVAAAKLRRAQTRVLAARPYAVKISEMLDNLAGGASDIELPLFKAREVRKTALVVITASRGLCGAYNTNVLREAEDRLRRAAPDSLCLVLVGKKARDYFRRRRWPVLATYADVPSDTTLEFARAVTDDVIGRFLAGDVDRVEIVYTRFLSALRRHVTTEVFVPIGAERAAGAEPARDFIFEPDAPAIFAELLPRYATAKMFAALADARASEESARMMAMGAATKNAGELLDQLVMARNRARQSMITKEILDIVGGAEALR